MTPIDQFDPFERRIADAIDEIASAQRPAYLDDVLRLTARTPQRSRRGLWRATSMNRLAYAAAAVAVVAVLAGGALFFKASPSSGGPPNMVTPSVGPTSAGDTSFHLTGRWTSLQHPRETLTVEPSVDGGPILLGTVRDQDIILMQDHMNANGGLLSLASAGIGCPASASSSYAFRVNPLGNAFWVGNDVAGTDPCPNRAAVYGGGWSAITASDAPSPAATIDRSFDLTGTWMSLTTSGITLVIDPALVGGPLPLSTIRDPKGVVVMQDYINAGEGLMALQSTGLAGGCSTTEWRTYFFRRGPTGDIRIGDDDPVGNPDPCAARAAAYHGGWSFMWRP